MLTVGVCPLLHVQRMRLDARVPKKQAHLVVQLPVPSDQTVPCSSSTTSEPVFFVPQPAPSAEERLRTRRASTRKSGSREKTQDVWAVQTRSQRAIPPRWGPARRPRQVISLRWGPRPPDPGCLWSLDPCILLALSASWAELDGEVSKLSWWPGDLDLHPWIFPGMYHQLLPGWRSIASEAVPAVVCAYRSISGTLQIGRSCRHSFIVHWASGSSRWRASRVRPHNGSGISSASCPCSGWTWLRQWWRQVPPLDIHLLLPLSKSLPTSSWPCLPAQAHHDLQSAQLDLENKDTVAWAKISDNVVAYCTI